MTEAEQARIVARRLKIRQQVANDRRHVAQTYRYFGISRTAIYRRKRCFDQSYAASGCPCSRNVDEPKIPLL